MAKRGLIIGGYNTAAKGWTLQAGWRLADATQKTNYVNKTGGDGSWDLSTVLTDGIPTYNTRTLTATFECSEGDRLSREALIDEMINQLDGYQWDIFLPDDSLHYVSGRVHVVKNYNDLAHASVTVTAICDPWRYADTDTVVTLTTRGKHTLRNGGRRAVVPVLTVEGEDASVLLGYGDGGLSMSAGTYTWPVLMLTPGDHVITVNATGTWTLTITYREAVL